MTARPPICFSDHTRGLSATKESPFTVYAATMMWLSKVSKNSSCPLRDHIGYAAAAVRDLPLAALVRKGSHVNSGRSPTHRKRRPATARREKRKGSRSSAGVCRKTSGFPARSPAPSLSSGTVHKSNEVFESCS